MKKVVAHILKLKIYLLQENQTVLTSKMDSIGIPLINLKLLQEATNIIIKSIQANHFKDEHG